MKLFVVLGLFSLACLLVVLGSRESRFERAPFILFPDMDFQQSHRPQGESHFYADASSSRSAPKGTVARTETPSIVFSPNYAYDKAKRPEFYTGKDAKGAWLRGFPLNVDDALLQVGRERYDIFCTPCHGLSGDGDGITKSYGMAATPSYHGERLRQDPEGKMFHVITHGQGLMGAYASQLSPKERWAVVAYVRALQLTEILKPAKVSEASEASEAKAKPKSSKASKPKESKP